MSKTFFSLFLLLLRRFFSSSFIYKASSFILSCLLAAIITKILCIFLLLAFFTLRPSRFFLFFPSFSLWELFSPRDLLKCIHSRAIYLLLTIALSHLHFPFVLYRSYDFSFQLSYSYSNQVLFKTFWGLYDFGILMLWNCQIYAQQLPKRNFIKFLKNRPWQILLIFFLLTICWAIQQKF